MSGLYQVQGDPIRNGLFPDTGKPPISVFCAHFSDKPGTISLLGGVFTTPYLESIEFTASLQVFPTRMPLDTERTLPLGRGEEVVPTRDRKLRPPWVNLGLTRRSGTWTGKHPCCVRRCRGHLCLRPIWYNSFER